MITHGELQEAVRCWVHVPFYRIGMVEVGLPNRTRADVLAYEPKDNSVRLVECKVTSRDLRAAPEQLRGYQKYADMVYLAVPDTLEKEARDLLFPKIGLLLVTEHHTGYSDRRYLSTRCARNPRRSELNGMTRKRMMARALTWLLAHYEQTIVCKNCGHRRLHGPA